MTVPSVESSPGAVPAALALVLLAAALLLVVDRPRRTGPVPAGVPRPDPDPRLVRFGLPVAVFLAAALVAPGAWWLAVGAAAGLAAGRSMRDRWRARGSPRERAERRRWLIGHADLLASCLESGLAPAAALRAVGAVLPSPDAGGRSPAGPGPSATLEAVAAMLTLGADPDTAWRVADADDDLAPLAAAARRSAAGGTTLADAVREHAAQLRDRARQEDARSAGRAGVLMTAPLGVCFLPAFLCLGLAPVVLGLLSRLTIR